MSHEEPVKTMAVQARQAARALATMSSGVKDNALEAMACALTDWQEDLLDANRRDLADAETNGLDRALIDRLTLTPARIAAMAEGLRIIANLCDPVGEVISGWRRPNGMRIRQLRVPLGVVGIIYESRPNVTVDAAGLCLKAGNATILRGGKEALHSNLALTRVIAEAAEAAGIPAGAIQLIDTPDRAAAHAMMTANGLIDVLIPRGGTGLIQTVVQTATVPVIETGTGICHTYIDSDADLDMAEEIAFNAKVQRCNVCNTMETLLVHAGVAEAILPRLGARLAAAGVELRGCEETRRWLPDAVPATDVDWDTEYLDMILSIRVVASLDDAIDHITRHGTKHSECIVTNNLAHSERFAAEVDAAAVYTNVSTRFTDGFEFGFGAEIGISTQKLHARGPMGLEALTTTKYVVCGEGQIRM